MHIRRSPRVSVAVCSTAQSGIQDGIASLLACCHGARGIHMPTFQIHYSVRCVGEFRIIGLDSEDFLLFVKQA